ncbi:MAG: hypothetical protein IAG10_25435 [Planctomycetaceae bacterium]|nr:hypothetical protein [Planctomycetaceae bacterium]
MRLALWFRFNASSKLDSIVATFARTWGFHRLAHVLENVATVSTVLVGLAGEALDAAEVRSHTPMRTPPEATRREREAGPALFVDAQRGDDAHAGSEVQPWRTLRHALRKLKPGDTLYLRSGTYYERPVLSRSGTAEAPVTIRSYPGESVVIDGGLREFFETPAASWEPLSGGATGEFVSTRTYRDLDDRRVPHQFLPAAWEPLWGIEDERPIALGNFGDSMVPLHGYRFLADLRATNEFWLADKKSTDIGMYCGPGLWFNRDTGRVHIRLAHHTLPGLGERSYRGETDPRKLPLIVALGFGDDVLRISGIKHVRVRDLTLRGATGSPMIHVYGSESVELDHLTVFGGFPGLLVNASKKLRVTHSVFRGLAAPWTGRAHMKYRGTASYQIVLQNNQPLNEDIEFAFCEFTDDHDFAFLRYAKSLRLHHCLVDHFNDDGLECGPKLRDHTISIYQNRIGACLGVFQQHEIDKDESPLGHAAGSGVFIFRNVIDTRAGVPYQHPKEPDPSGSFLHAEGHLLGNHGSPVDPVMRFYHNTVLRESPVFRGYFLFGLGSMGPQPTERDVFNNIFVERQGIPGPGFVALKEPGQLREGGNLLWGVEDGPKTPDDLFAKFRASPLFKLSQKHHAPGWTTHDRLADPKFVSLPSDPTATSDLRLQPDSPALDAGQPIPSEWPDPLRESDTDRPDIGALPRGADPWGVGVNSRLSIFSGQPTGKK